MLVQVKAAGHLFHRMPDGQREMQVNMTQGETVLDLLAHLGLHKRQVWIIHLNGENVDAEQSLADGDSVVLYPLIGGG